MRQQHSWLGWMILYVGVLGVFAVFSYSLTAPNLILSNWSPYWSFQTWMWKTFFNNRPLLTLTYGSLITLLLATYGGLMHALHRVLRKTQHQGVSSLLSKTRMTALVMVCALPLVFANNALSYDVFNYIFNAKMVAVYQANPHSRVALDFAYDDWTRFMHNTHTPAPYGYGWTALSLIPFMIGQEKFAITWFLFRLFSLLSLGLLAHVLLRFVSTTQHWWVLAVLIHPLLLIEIVSNSHNDLWMMLPAVASLLLVSRQANKGLGTKTIELHKAGWRIADWSSWRRIIGSLALLAFSISIKFATIVLIPVWLLLFFMKGTSIAKHWAFFASLALFSLLLTNRSQQFHPWYLSWVLVWLPFITVPAWRWSVLALSVSSLYRYLPFLWHGEYTPQVLIQQKRITWLPWILATSLLFVWFWRKKNNDTELTNDHSYEKK